MSPAERALSEVGIKEPSVSFVDVEPTGLDAAESEAK